MAKTHEQFCLELSSINPDIEPINYYTKATERITVKCKICDNIWSPKAYSLLQGKGCPKCRTEQGVRNNKGKTHRKTTQEFAEQLKNIQPDISIIGEYKNTHTNIECLCKYCGNKWAAKPYSLLQGHGCPRCAKSGTSFMEQFILLSFSHALGKDAVLSRDRSFINMELDIVIPSLKIAIEPGNWVLHKKAIERDVEKRNRCRNCGVRLITIYDKFPDNESVPFDSDCFTFPFDLNKAERHIIHDLVYSLFELVNIKTVFDNEDWARIEQAAYDNARAKTHEDFITEMKTVNPTIDIIGKYVNSNRRIQVKCKKCGHTWNAVPASLLSGERKKKCGVIAAHMPMIKSQYDFIKDIANCNPDVEIIGEYIGRHNPVKARCKICGYEWSPIASSLLRGSSHKGAKAIHKKYSN